MPPGAVTRAMMALPAAGTQAGVRIRIVPGGAIVGDNDGLVDDEFLAVGLDEIMCWVKSTALSVAYIKAAFRGGSGLIRG